MEGHIINPAIFYWMNTVGDIKFVLVLIAVVAFIVSAMFAYVYIATKLDIIAYEGCATKIETMKKGLIYYKKIIKWVVPILAIALVLLVFIPNREAILYMVIADVATYENAEITVEAIKSAVDYIVEAIGRIG